MYFEPLCLPINIYRYDIQIYIYTYIHLGVLYIWAHFELDFEVSPLEFALPHAQKNIHKHMCTFVGVLHHYIGIWAHFELCLELFPMWFELLPLHTTYTLMHLDVLYVFVWVWAHFELDFELSPLEFVLSHTQQDVHKHICTFVGVLHHYIGIWAHFELCLEFFPMWFELLPLHTTYTLMHLDVLYVFVWAHFELGLELFPLEFALFHAQKNIHKHMCTFVGVLHHYIDIWAHFELCLEFFPMWCELLPLHTTYTLVSYTCSFEPILSLILVFPHWNLSYPMHKKTTQTYVYLCWLSASLHPYLSSLWALSWAFSNVIWAAAFTYYIYLDAPWCPICVCLSAFCAWFWAFPNGIWGIPCTKKHT